MKIKHITIVLFVFLLTSCIKNKNQIINSLPSPFKPALEQVVRDLIDSLKNEIGENQLLSMAFHFPNEHINYRNRQGVEMKFFILDGYASANIDGYVKVDGTLIAIYNLKDDVFELVNKNEITFFADTIVGFKDVCILLGMPPEKQFFYKMIKEDSILKSSDMIDFPYLLPLRRTRCQGGLTATLPEEWLFYSDSLCAEKNLKYYQEAVEYYRNTALQITPCK